MAGLVSPWCVLRLCTPDGTGGQPDAPAPPAAEPTPDDADARLERLGDRIAEISARIQAATYELLSLIREFDQQNGWSGSLTCAQWLSWRTGLAPGAAREHVRVAHALGALPKLSNAMRRGRVSYSKVRAVTRVATSENEQALLDVALAGTAEHVERIVRGWRRVDRSAEQAEEQRQDASRSLRTWVDDDGMVVVRGAAYARGRGGSAAGAGGGVRRGPAHAGVGRGRRDCGGPRRCGCRRGADARAAAGGRHRGRGGGGARRRARQGQGWRPVSGGAAHRRGGTDGTARRSSGNAGRRCRRDPAAGMRRVRSSGNVGRR